MITFTLSAILIIASISLPFTKSEPYEDKEALLDFIRNIHHSRSLNWDTNFPVCFLWTGVTCNSDNTRVVALRLPGMGLRGSIPSNTLSRLSSLQILSLRSNGISGDFPQDFSNLRNLTSLYLQSNNNKLVFFEGCRLAFDLEDLLRASAEVLGKGSYGTTYKAALEDATTTVVVKRLKEVGVGKKEFEGQMEVVGGIKHENVCPLRAYYYSKDEKLMVYDFYDRGSVSVLLHGRRGEGRTALDWETRMRIAIGAARGIFYIHSTRQSAAKQLVHGNIKASNVFLNSDNYGSINDVGLATLITPTPAPAPNRSASSGYRAPEVTDPRKATPAADVYSFGVLLLELLTGKSPTNSSSGGGSGGEEVVHLVRWVNSVVREEWTAEVFDVELLRYPNIEEEMVEMLQIGMNCVVRMPEQRPKMVDVVKMVEGIRRAGGSVSVSPGEGRGFGSDSGVEVAMSTPTPPGSDRVGSSSSAIQ
ncbi:unnamed protein product [Linum tenue]|uniref:Protein kinase domain-containing protein n=1 Tax=Linum tenue TaxID=586396 RepID=A0AAV0MST3_9ROSI|nr:unnamed protein product [Linum tenue]